MDQAVLAGVGNVYRAEVLFRHRIHPLRPGQHAAARPVPADVGRPGDADGTRASAPAASTPCTPSTRPRRWAGRRGSTTTAARSTSTGATGSPATSAAATVRTQELAGRNLFWCPRCQPMFRSRAVGVSRTLAVPAGVHEPLGERRSRPLRSRRWSPPRTPAPDRPVGRPGAEPSLAPGGPAAARVRPRGRPCCSASAAC